MDQDTAEARIARDADVLDAILHVRESLADRPGLQQRWVDYLAETVTTDAGRTVLAEIRATDPDDWWPRTVTGETSR